MEQKLSSGLYYLNAKVQMRVVVKRLREARWIILSSVLSLFSISFIYMSSATPTNDYRYALLGTLFVILTAAFIPRKSSIIIKQSLLDKNKLEHQPSDEIKQFASAINSPVYIINEDGIIDFANESALEIFGPTRLKVPFLFKFRSPEVRDIVEKSLKTKQHQYCDFHEKSPTERFFQASITPVPAKSTDSLKGANSSLAYYYVVRFQDQTVFRQAEITRTDFVANASHELRTPLASLSGFIETMQGPARNDRQAQNKFLTIMQDQADRMSRLVDDLLSLSRIEMKAHRQPTQSVNLNEIVNHVADAMTPLANEAGVDLIVQATQHLPDILGERDELIQVFDNLVDNAIKYGRSGGRVEIVVNFNESPDDLFPISVDVQDFGPGIAREHLQRLTERFYRVDIEESRQQKGTGLGLAIVKHILTRHKGRLDIFSKVNQGAIFSARFSKDSTIKSK